MSRFIQFVAFRLMVFFSERQSARMQKLQMTA